MSTLVEISSHRHGEGRKFQQRSLSENAHAIGRILVCVDQSPFSEACLQHGIAISKSLGAAITLLHVMEPAHERSGLHTTDVLDWEISRQEARAYLERLQKDATNASGRQVDIRLEQGHPAERIAAVARELGADLTILGSQGEHGVTAWNLGSTAQQVLAVAHGSVLIARSPLAISGEVSPKRILVPLDGSLRAESVLPTVVRIASAHGAELLLVFVVNEPVASGVLSAPGDIAVARDLATRLEAGAKRYLEGLRDQLRREGASVCTLVLRNADERQSLFDLSQRERSDLIVVSAHGSTCNPALTCGSVTAHLLLHSTVPLLVLQDLRDSELRGQKREQSAPPLRGLYSEGG
jgi:nucleotide-binding universal stress UspA family protein